jgi:transcriptional regulator NrdR family protein
MKCEKCGNNKTATIAVEPIKDGTSRRRRKCSCGHKFSTIEMNFHHLEEIKLAVKESGKVITRLLNQYTFRRK